MKETTLCYVEQDGSYLMLYRNKKEQDPNEGKWIGVGGKLNAGETPEECLLREVWEETGLTLTKYEARGVIRFVSDRWEEEVMYLYTASEFDGTISETCDEGELRWVRKEKIEALNLWEGDRIFLKALLGGEKEIRLTLRYEGDTLVSYEWET